MWERTTRMDAQELKSKTPDQLKDQLVALKKEAFNLRRLYIWLMGLNVVMLVCPILRHFQWERHMQRKAARSE